MISQYNVCYSAAGKLAEEKHICRWHRRKKKKSKQGTQPGVTVHIYNPSTQETKQKYKFKACLGNLKKIFFKNPKN